MPTLPFDHGWMRQPGDHLLAVDLLLLGIFALGWNAFACAESANIDAHAHVSTPREIRVLGIVARGRAVIFAIRQIFEQGGELLAGLRAVGHVESCRQANAILHRNPRLLHAHSVGRRRRRFAGEAGRRTRTNENARCIVKSRRFWPSAVSVSADEMSDDQESILRSLLPAHGAQIDPQLLRFFIQVTALQAKRFRGKAHVLMAALQFCQNHLALERLHAVGERPGRSAPLAQWPRPRKSSAAPSARSPDQPDRRSQAASAARPCCATREHSPATNAIATPPSPRR